ncbi:hypothetical protein CS063_01610 [Sporanaerobium hydrogeniformans]|uniref:Uncharacterized protein n=1 Tax=Sporanaerobium hydrogeniformans TaxID=3072179 RepID=A0AC61DKI3_9FIRM|nr:M15 family metallopeptidase [Sporanaerobium hydrogeniformans]PHV72197.1 hypothetical protein CS063_01610 [Sporanaerobium hydrogeniformans]
MSIDRCDDIKELHPKVRELAEKLLVEAKKQGLDAKIIDTYRSPERQDFLYAQGRTKPGAIVTNARGKDKSSYHNWRLAFDCIQNSKTDPYNAAFLAKLGKIGQSLGLEWGGGWSSFKDAPHFQYTYGLSIKQLNAGAKIPTYIPPKQVDQELVTAIDKLVVAGVKMNACNWNSIDKMDLRYAETLILRIGALFGFSDYKATIDYLQGKEVITDRTLWDRKEFVPKYIRTILIRVSKLV